MKIITGDEAVFKLLEKTGHSDFDPARPAVHLFLSGNDLLFLIYNPRGKKKGCRLYILEEPNRLHETRNVLLPDLLRLQEDDGYGQLKTEALQLAERMISGEKREGQFYDAH